MTILHVAFGFSGPSIPIEKVQNALGKNAGWARYAPNCWIVDTPESPADLARRLHTLCKEGDSVFVCELNLRNNFGWLQKELWDWINQRNR